MKLSHIIRIIEEMAPPVLQESYDNSGLQVGDPNAEISGALISLDVTEKVVEEALTHGCGLIISHHPLIFGEMRSLTGRTPNERTVIMAIRNNIAIYSAHTSLDNVREGVSKILCERLGIKKTKVLAPRKNLLRKLVTFCPENEADKVRNALFEAGAGHIGDYDSCSFNLPGRGSFRGLEGTDPFVGETGKLHFEDETRLEVIYPVYLENAVIDAMLDAHPYEEVAYDIYPLENEFSGAGSGMVGYLDQDMEQSAFLSFVKEKAGSGCVKHSVLTGRKIRKVAVCGGSGAFLIPSAIGEAADAFLTGEIKYHDFYKADGKILLAAIGHYESERFSKELLMRGVNEKIPNFAVRLAKTDINPVNYL